MSKSKPCKDCSSLPCTCEQPCKVCDEPTRVIFNINFRATHICESCAMKITKQQVAAL